MSDALVTLVRAGSTPALLAIADALESGAISLDSSSVGIKSIKGVSSDLAAQTFKTFQAVRSWADVGTVSVALRTAAGIREQEQLERPKVEICWTGPDAEGPLVTPNAVAIKQLLEDCRDTGEILLVGYSLTVGDDSFMKEVMALLVDASKRGAKLQVVLHDNEGKNLREFKDNWDVFVRKPYIYTWSPPPDHPYTKLHAKCLVVDRLQMLVTSANFTFHGLESNIELGLLVRNQPLASAVHDRFDHLISSKVLHPWTDAA